MVLKSPMVSILVPDEFCQYNDFLPDGTKVFSYQCTKLTLFNKIHRKFLAFLSTRNPKSRIIIKSKPHELDQISVLYLPAWLVLLEHEHNSLLKQLPNLRWIYSQKTGIEHLPLTDLKDKNIQISNSGTLVSSWVAQTNVACILAHAKRIPTHICSEISLKKQAVFTNDISLATIAIIGTGNIGQNTAQLCQALGMNVIGFSRNPKSKTPNEFFNKILPCSELDNILPKVDYLILAIPLTDETRDSIGLKQFNQMKSSACLINFARPAIVNQKDLVNSIKTNNIAAVFTSTLLNTARFTRFKLALGGRIILTHHSEAHLVEKNKLAYKQFSKLLAEFITYGKIVQTGKVI